MVVNVVRIGMNVLLCMPLGISLWMGLRRKRVQRHSAVVRLVMDWRYRRAVRAMPVLDDFGRPVTV